MVVAVVVTVVVCFRWGFGRVGRAVACVFVVAQRQFGRGDLLCFSLWFDSGFGRASPLLRILLWF